MNSKKANWLFLSTVLITLTVIVLINVFYLLTAGKLEIGIILNLVISQLTIVIPALFFALFSKSGLNEMLGYHKIKISSALMAVLFSYLLMPLVTAVNAISMLFVDNTVNAMSGDILQISFPVMLFLIGIFGPFCEEFVCRGMIFGGYKKSGSVFKAIVLSSLVFGLLHLNFNQATYAIVLGVCFSLLVEATGSLWASTIAHMVINTTEVCMMFLVERLLPGIYTTGQTEDMLTTQTLLAAIGPYLLVATITTALAGCVLVWIAKNENREEHLKDIWTKRKEKKERLITVPLIIAMVLSIAFMIFDVILMV
ncbi:MAG: type II CAAX endopeptidase family protein [Lachnospiraceae bacterium]|nr:type II CAAX endopeptidase family protein [Lachnospiraceae bacterium]